jgi:hypothetical protein
MTWQARTLCTLYAAVTLWLAYCTTETWGHVPLWTSLVMAAASIVTIVAGRREAEHADDTRGLRAELERATRPPLNRPAITEQERATFKRIIAGLDLDDAA